MLKKIIFISLIATSACQTGKLQEDETILKPAITLSSPSEGQSGEPNFFVAKDSTIYLSWIQNVNDSLSELKYAIWQQDQWSDPTNIARGENWFVNWADFPSIIATESTIAAHWLQKSNQGTYDYNIQVSLSSDEGKNWTPPFVLHQDTVSAEHGFVTMQPVTQDSILAVWLDGRNTKATPNIGSHSHGAMQLRANYFNNKGQLGKEVLLDSMVCDCCQTDVALTQYGPIVVYRNRTEKEIRDIYTIRQVDGKWGNPVPVYPDQWAINGCPVNGPAIAATGESVVVAWFSAPQENKPEVKVSFSNDGGSTFAKPVRLDEGKPLGRVDAIMISEEVAIISWLETMQNTAEIRIATVTADGQIKDRQTLASTVASRASGFPVIEKAGGHVFFAWTQIDSIASIQTAMMSIDAFE